MNTFSYLGTEITNNVPSCFWRYFILSNSPSIGKITCKLIYASLIHMSRLKEVPNICKRVCKVLRLAESKPIESFLWKNTSVLSFMSHVNIFTCGKKCRLGVMKLPDQSSDIHSFSWLSLKKMWKNKFTQNTVVLLSDLLHLQTAPWQTVRYYIKLWKST